MYEWLPRALFTKTEPKQFCGIREPLAEVIIHVDHRNFCLSGTFLQPSEMRSNLKSISQQLSPIGELKMIDDIDQQECLSGFMFYVVIRHGRTPQAVESFPCRLRSSANSQNKNGLLAIHSPNSFCQGVNGTLTCSDNFKDDGAFEFRPVVTGCRLNGETLKR